MVVKIPHGLFSLLFPDECRVCGVQLAGITRVPVCGACLRAPRPLAADYFCSSCRTPFLNAFPLDEEGRCALCRSGLRSFDTAYCFGEYEGGLRELIHLFKYGGMKPLGAPLSAHLAAALPRDLRFDAVVPVPLHWRRAWTRGFNQSALLAAPIARRSGIRMMHALTRSRATETQAGLTNSRRRSNVAKAFRMRRGRSVQDLRILLIDDVMTTGATASACASALKKAGAKSVALLTLARVDRRTAASAASGTSGAF